MAPRDHRRSPSAVGGHPCRRAVRCYGEDRDDVIARRDESRVVERYEWRLVGYPVRVSRRLHAPGGDDDRFFASGERRVAMSGAATGRAELETVDGAEAGARRRALPRRPLCGSGRPRRSFGVGRSTTAGCPRSPGTRRSQEHGAYPVRRDIHGRERGSRRGRCPVLLAGRTAWLEPMSRADRHWGRSRCCTPRGGLQR